MLKLTWIDFCRQRRTMWACSRAALCWSLRAMDSGFRLLLLPVELTFSRTWLQRLSIGMTLSTQQTTHTVVVDIMIIIVICVILIILTIRVSLLGPGEQWGGGEGGAVQDQDVAGNPPLIQSWSTFDEVWPGMIFFSLRILWCSSGPRMIQWFREKAGWTNLLSQLSIDHHHHKPQVVQQWHHL